MDDALLVGVLQPPGGLEDALHGLRHRQRALLLDDGGQVLALDVLHHQVMDALVLAGIVGRDDVGMR